MAKAFKGVQALAGVDLEVRRGEILGLVGPNGSGKSTLINVVSGHYPADGGAIRFEGAELVGMPAHRIARAGIARTYQIPRPFAHLTVLRERRAAADVRPGGHGPRRAPSARRGAGSSSPASRARAQRCPAS